MVLVSRPRAIGYAQLATTREVRRSGLTQGGVELRFDHSCPDRRTSLQVKGFGSGSGALGVPGDPFESMSMAGVFVRIDWREPRRGGRTAFRVKSGSCLEMFCWSGPSPIG